MVTKAEKKIVEEAGKKAGDLVGEVLETAKEKVREDLGITTKKGVNTGSNQLDKIFADLAEQFETISVKIDRKNDRDSWEFFVKLDGIVPVELHQKGVDVLCAEEGGQGVYRVTLIPPTPGDKQLIGPVNVGGFPRRAISKTLEQSQGGVGGLLPFGGQPGMFGMGPVQTDHKTVQVTRDFLTHMKSSNDQVMSMMGQNQNQFMQLMAMMFGPMGQGKLGGPSDEVRLLTQKIDQMERQRLDDQRRADEKVERERERQREEDRRREDMRRMEERLQTLTQQMTDQKTNSTIELLRTQQSQEQNRDSNWLQMLAMAREDAKSNKSDQLEWMKLLVEKSSPSDHLLQLTQHQTKQSLDTLNIITQLAASGLLEGNGGGSPIRQAFANLIESSAQALPEVLSGIRGAMEEREDAREMAQHQELPTVNIPPGGVQVNRLEGPSLTTSSDMQRVPIEGEEEEPTSGTVESEEELRKALLSPEELQKMSTDDALVKAIECAKEGNIHEATARLFAHAEVHGQGWSADIARRWLNYPGPLSAQILTSYGAPEKMIAMAQDISEFWAFIQAQGDPNEWSKATGYKPIKKKSAGGMGIVGHAPEFGMQRGEPAEGQVYDPSKPPAGATPEMLEEIEKQRQKRRQEAEEAAAKEAEERAALERGGTVVVESAPAEPVQEPTAEEPQEQLEAAEG